MDLGCGSGVLAIAAARLGYAPVLALDNDPASVQATADNAAVNGVELEVRRFDLRSEDVPAAGHGDGEPAGAAVAGLGAAAGRIAGAGAARLIASGLLVAEADGIAEAFAAAGLREADRRESGEWGALLLERA